jgi:hypothetical protein
MLGIVIPFFALVFLFTGFLIGAAIKTERADGNPLLAEMTERYAEPSARRRSLRPSLTTHPPRPARPIRLTRGSPGPLACPDPGPPIGRLYARPRPPARLAAPGPSAVNQRQSMNCQWT